MSSEATNTGVSKSSGGTTSGSTSDINKDKMAEKVPDYAAFGAEIASTLTAANAMSEGDVKKYKAKIYNLFKGIDQAKVDFGVTAYFLVNDPSANADWGKANPIVIGSAQVPAANIAGDIISMAQGDGLLRKFLSSAYEKLVPVVIEHTKGVAEVLNARAAKHGVTGASPIAVVSWVRGVHSETSANAGTRALLRTRATMGKSDVKVVPGVGGELHTPTPTVKNTGTSQEFF